MGKYFAHTLGEDEQDWQPLADHLAGAAGLARGFGERFEAGDWAGLAGLLHDAGKFRSEFQTYLREGGRRGSVDHASPGAALAVERLEKNTGTLLAYAIAGHHGGMPDGSSPVRSLGERISRGRNLALDIPPECPGPLSELPVSDRLPFSLDKKRLGFELSFFTRMLFSCLVDADWLDTEAFLDRDKAAERGGYPTVAELLAVLDPALDDKSRSAPPTPVNRLRAEVLAACRNAAESEPGLFSLTVPTGGGKTLSSLAFALRHAARHGLDRVIYVIPYTSIIEQTAGIFRGVLGDAAVVEHHSAFTPDEEDLRQRLAAENWDAPLIVTTAVQFFESLFANTPSRCRKLHNVAASVVILDEAQMLPPDLLKPCVEAVRELALHYRASLVLCTATQPALLRSEECPWGLDHVREIAPEPERLHAALRRVAAVLEPTPLADADLAARLSDRDQALCIVNTRSHARALFKLLGPGEGAFHLSAAMCPAHRSAKLEDIRKALREGRPCRVVATSLVEAGVDVDFPEVLRAMAGLDSLAQAAGRCNREGRLAGLGRLTVFEPADWPLPKRFRVVAQAAASALRRTGGDPLAMAGVEDYFRELYWIRADKLDAKDILGKLRDGAKKLLFPFRTVAEEFRVIESLGEPIVIPWAGPEGDDAVRAALRALEYADFVGAPLRKLQRYTVQVYPWEMARLEAERAVRRVKERFAVLEDMRWYSPDLGLSLDNEPEFLPEDLTI